MFKDKSRKRGILRSERYLSPKYVPDEPVGRKREVEHLASVLQPAVRRRKPGNVWVHGPAGAGKTVCVRHILQRLEEDASVRTVFINCWQYNTRSSLITELLIKLGYPAVRRGKSVDELFSKLRIWLDRNRSIVVALDEIDQLRDRTEVVYDLQHVNEQSDNVIGLVLVSNSHPSNVHLDQRAKSRLSCRTKVFHPYSVEELREILESRAEMAFKEGAVPSNHLHRISSAVAEQDGDCRKAFEILLRAGREAHQEQSRQVTEAHVQRAISTTVDLGNDRPSNPSE